MKKIIQVLWVGTLAAKLFLSVLCANTIAADQAPALSRPNILFAIADDWGVHGGAYGTKWVQTPAFDRVAREGILFTHFIDVAPTFIELAGLKWSETGMAESPGRSLTDLFQSDNSGVVNPARDHVLIGKERTDIGRPHDGGYPIRGIVRGGWLYLRNFEPARWPAGNPETGYLDCDVKEMVELLQRISNNGKSRL